MFSFLKKLFGLGGPAVDYAALLAAGAQIIDVRTPSEFASGHIKGSKNVPLQTLDKNLNKIAKGKPVITCCASGMRSAAARNILQANGYEVYNGGGWMSLQQQIK